MPSRLHRRAFTLPELIVVSLLLAMLLPLGAMALNASSERSRRNQCFDKLKTLGLALQQYERAKRRYPAACFGTQPGADPVRDCRPAGASGGIATTGYSWALAIQGQLCNALYTAAFQGSQKFTVPTGPFTASITYVQANQHISCVPLPDFVCPSWSGDGYTNSRTTIDVGPACGAPAGCGAPEYANIDSNVPGTGSQSFKGKVAITNYKPMVGTHTRNGLPINNGGIDLSGQGFTEGAISDGTSKTIFLCETKESGYASWYDGTLNWLVGNDPNKPTPSMNGNADSPPWSNGSMAINRGFDPKVPGSVPYLKKTLTENSPLNDVWWGPSSDHADGVVSHVFGDGHTLGITDAADPLTYLDLITRSGSEPVDGCERIR